MAHGAGAAATGRPILFSACEWGANKPWEWGRSAGCHMWRTTGDIEDSWESMEKLGFSQDGKQMYAGPGGWNDPDMLVVGMYGKGNVAKGGMSDTEYRVHFALWCMLASPLMIGCDVRKMTPAAKEILTHKGLIAINQDPMGRQGWRVGTDADKFDTWMKPMAMGRSWWGCSTGTRPGRGICRRRGSRWACTIGGRARWWTCGTARNSGCTRGYSGARCLRIAAGF